MDILLLFFLSHFACCFFHVLLNTFPVILWSLWRISVKTLFLMYIFLSSKLSPSVGVIYFETVFRNVLGLQQNWENSIEMYHMLHAYSLQYSWLPLWLSWYRLCLPFGRPGFNAWVGKIPWRRERLPTPVFWPGEFHGLYSSWGHKESDMAEWLSLSLSLPHTYIDSPIINIIHQKDNFFFF